MLEYRSSNVGVVGGDAGCAVENEVFAIWMLEVWQRGIQFRVHVVRAVGLEGRCIGDRCIRCAAATAAARSTVAPGISFSSVDCPHLVSADHDVVLVINTLLIDQ